MSAPHQLRRPEQALERLAGLPGGAELLAQARRREDVALVGGAVRDLLLGHWPRELDVTVGGDAAGLASALAGAISPSERAYGHAVEPLLHDRFGTASVAWDYGRIDIAELRAETYPEPGALPVVRAGSVEEDLARRDFTVNAISLPVAGAERGRLRAAEGALEDLAAGTLRVLHERSFIDDPTRILRLARYATRLGFAIEAQTRQLVEGAVAGGALGTVSGGRIGGELSLALHEADGRAVLRLLDELGVLGAVGMPSPFDEQLAAHAEALLPPDGRHDVLLMAVALHPVDDDEGPSGIRMLELMSELELRGELRDRVFTAANGAIGRSERVVRAVEELDDPATAFAMLDGGPVEGAAIVGALAGRHSEGAETAVRHWLAAARHVTLEIDGNDLLAAGVPEGPEVGARLRGALKRKREGGVVGRDQELRAALEGEVEPIVGWVET